MNGRRVGPTRVEQWDDGIGNAVHVDRLASHEDHPGVWLVAGCSIPSVKPLHRNGLRAWDKATAALVEYLADRGYAFPSGERAPW